MVVGLVKWLAISTIALGTLGMMNKGITVWVSAEQAHYDIEYKRLHMEQEIHEKMMNSVRTKEEV